MGDQLNTYLTRLTLAGLRPETIRVRKVCLTAFAATVPSLVRATREDIEAYLGRPLAPATRSAYASHLRAFYRYLVEEEIRQDDPTAKLPRFREPKRLPRPINDADLTMAIDRADRRMRAWLLLMSLAGLRCMEVAALAPRDLIETDAGMLLRLRVTKGGGPATMPAHPAVVGALAAMPIRNGLWWSVGPSHVSMSVAAYLRALGIDATAHQLRHWAVTTWYETSDHDLLTTAGLSRHANLNNVRIYAQVNPRRPAEVVNLVALPSAS